MTTRYRLVLLTSVALPLFAMGPGSATAQPETVQGETIILAPADSLAAAQAEVAAAQAALLEAQTSGGDVAAAQARLDAALNALAAAEAAAQAETPAELPVEQEALGAPQEAPAEQPEAEAVPTLEPPAAQSAEPPVEAPGADTGQTDTEAPAGAEPPSAAPAELPPPEQAPVQDVAPPAEPAPQPEAGPVPTLEPPAAESAQPPAEAAEPEIPLREMSPQPPQAAEPPVEAPGSETPPGEPAAPADTGEMAPEVEAPQGQAPASSPASGGEPAVPTAAEPVESGVEAQLEAQGDEEAVENVRALRSKLQEEFTRSEPESEADQESRREAEADRRPAAEGEQARSGEGRVGRDGERRRRERPAEGDVVFEFNLGVIVQLGDQLVVRRDSAYDSERFLDRARDVEVEHFPGGYTRTVVTRHDGTRIYTVRDRYGEIVTRTRVTPDGHRVVLIDNRAYYRDGRPARHVRFDDELPPLRLEIPRDQYIVETNRVGRDEIRAALLAPPVEEVERAYALEEIRTSERLRDKVRRVDLNTITFDFGSAAISPSQFEALSAVGETIEAILANSPNEIFLIEGHTDAVGPPTDNLILSDRRAEAVAVALSSNFAIPPENLVTQGYGEQYLKIATEAAERENRRVTVRRITPLVAQGS